MWRRLHLRTPGASFMLTRRWFEVRRSTFGRRKKSQLDAAFEVKPNLDFPCQIKVTEALDGLIVRTPGLSGTVSVTLRARCRFEACSARAVMFDTASSLLPMSPPAIALQRRCAGKKLRTAFWIFSLNSFVWSAIICALTRPRNSL